MYFHKWKSPQNFPLFLTIPLRIFENFHQHHPQLPQKIWVKMASKLVFIGAGRICPFPPYRSGCILDAASWCDVKLCLIYPRHIECASDRILPSVLVPHTQVKKIFLFMRKWSFIDSSMNIREYQDSDFFPDQLQTFIERCIGHQRFQMWKNFSKISIPFRQV